MSKTALLGWRYVAPGLIVYAYAAGLFWLGGKSFSLIEPLWVAVPFGLLFYVVQPRDHYIRAPMERVVDNIKNTLLEIGESDPRISSAAGQLRLGRTLMNVFYGLVDNDNSLQDRANDVRMNGAVLSTLCDLIVVSWLAVFVSASWGLYAGNLWMFSGVAVGLIIALGTERWALPRVTERHIQLSDWQLGYIADDPNLARKAIDKMRGAIP